MPTTVVNKKTGEPYDIYIGRPSFFGNPYKVGDTTWDGIHISSREAALELYERLMWKRLNDENMTWWLHELEKMRGKRLGCWCKPLPCHGDVLVKIIGIIWG